MRNIKLSVKLIGGFVLVALLTLVVGLVGWFNSRDLGGRINFLGKEVTPAVTHLMSAQKALQAMRVAQRTLLNPEADENERQAQHTRLDTARRDFTKELEAFAAFPRTGEEDGVWLQLATPLKEALEINQQFLDHSHQLVQTQILNPVALLERLESFRGDLYKLMADTGSLLLTGVDSAGGGDPNITPFGIWLNTFKSKNEMVTKLLGLIKPEHENFHKAVKDIKDAMNEGGEAEAKLIYQTKVAPAAEKMFRAFAAILKEADKARQAYAKMNESADLVVTRTQPVMQLVDRLVEFNLKETSDAVNQSDAASQRATLISLGVSLLGVLVALALGVLLSLSITRPLNRVIDGLAQGSDQVASAAMQVKNASQALASGASQQAASLEETTAALEEMASMTRQNADNAGQADAETRSAGGLVERANQAMTELSQAMDAIHRAGGETAKIIKTIDEIAFQTNLLALNAAVEAARAGEAGAGFAVVAEEVRNLAMRAAEAAKNTAVLIETTIAKTRLGTELVGRSNQAFGEVASNAAKVGSLVAEIAAASSEQAQGIEQVNRAALDMDKVTQLNAANAEQSAAASEELTSQAMVMQDFVADLVTLVGGADQRGNGGQARPAVDAPPAPAREIGAEPVLEQRRKAQELIPFNDEATDF